MSHDIFISHSSLDKQVADLVCTHLEQNGIDCWVAARDILPGENWPKSIVSALGESKLVLLIFSSHSNDSLEIAREINLAANERIPILPFRIEDIKPSNELKYYLSTPHWLDAMPPPVHDHFERLVKSVRIFVPAPSSVDTLEEKKSPRLSSGNLSSIQSEPSVVTPKGQKSLEPAKSSSFYEQQNQSVTSEKIENNAVKPPVASKPSRHIEPARRTRPTESPQDKGQPQYFIQGTRSRKQSKPDIINASRRKWIFRSVMALSSILGVIIAGFIGFSLLSFFGNRDAEIEAFIKDFDEVSKEMATKIDSNPTATGIDNAQKVFDAKKAALKDKFGTFKNARGMQVSEATTKKLTDSIINNGKAISEAFGKHAMDYADEPNAAPKFQKLMKDYIDTFKL